MEGFPSTTEIDVRFAETDAQGVVHHAAYVVWLEVARIEYLARFAHGYRHIQAEGYEAIVTELDLAFRSAARFGDRVRVHARCRDVRGARFRYEYVLERDGERVADGSTGHALVDARTLRPTRVPTWLVEAIARAEA